MTAQRLKLAALLSLLFCLTPAAIAGDWKSLLQNVQIQHLPENTSTLLLVDLDRCRAADLSLQDRWLNVVIQTVLQRLKYENFLSFDEISSLAYFEYPEGNTSKHAWLVRGKLSAAQKKTILDFDDGTFLIGSQQVLRRTQNTKGPQDLIEILSRIDPGAAVAGVSRTHITLPFHSYEQTEQRPLPGVAFALKLDFGEGLRLYGDILTTEPASEEQGRQFITTLVDFLQPAGSFGPGGQQLAKEAAVSAKGLEIRIDATIPRTTLVSYGEMLNLWQVKKEGLLMNEARGGQAAVLLSDGTVAIAGGFDGQRGLTSVEIYDPVSQRFFPDALKLTRRRVASAFALDSSDRLFIFYGMDGIYEGLSNSNGEVVDFRNRTVKSFVVPKDAGRIGPTATMLGNGKILVAGGVVQKPGMESVSDAYLFDPQTLAFEAVPLQMKFPRGDHVAVLLKDGRVLLAGGVFIGNGMSNRHMINAMEIYDPGTNTFQALDQSLPFTRTGVAATLLPEGTVVFAGGFDADGKVYQDTYVWNPSEGKITSSKPMMQSRYYFAAVTLNNGTVLFTGGGMGLLAMRDDAEEWKPLP